MNEPATGCGSPCTLRRRAGFIAEKQKRQKKRVGRWQQLNEMNYSLCLPFGIESAPQKKKKKK